MSTKRSLFLVLAISVLGTVACSPRLVQTDPKLPPGFLDTPVPNGDLSAYLYLSQGSPATLPLEPFGDIERLRENSRLAERLPNEAAMHSLAIWMGPDLSSFGGDVVFTEETTAEIAQELLAGKSEDVTSWRTGARVSLVRGAGTWAEEMARTHRSGASSSFGEALPEAWELMRAAPRIAARRACSGRVPPSHQYRYRPSRLPCGAQPWAACPGPGLGQYR